MKKRVLSVEVDSEGRVILPAALAKRYGLTAGAKLRLEEDDSGFRLSRASESLARIYVEPTNQCNLDCLTCMRNVWDEPPGTMSEAVFMRLLESIRAVQPPPSVFFGGFGEPLTHPRIISMVEQARQAGAVVELITNGILLTERTIKGLINAGLNRLWVSLDGATPESYADVRLGAALPDVIANLRLFKDLRERMNSYSPSLGIAFVAMRRNIADLPELVQLGTSLGADQFSITHVLPHTPALRDEMLYDRALSKSGQSSGERAPLLAFPRIENSALSGESLLEVLHNHQRLVIARRAVHPGANACPFVEKGSVSVRWDGAVSPCLSLMHTHESYLDDHIRKSRAFSVGHLSNQDLVDIWNAPGYRDLRERLVQFDFSPCVACNSCEMAGSNEEDCFGNVAPACGGCLWAQGFIQCP